MLGATKSAVSKQVARLEQQLGTRLLHRTTRSISPTAEGRGVYERALRLLEEAQALDAELAGQREQPRGVLRLTDPRRFGAVVWSDGLAVEPAAKLLARIGLEPFDIEFHGPYLHDGFRGRRVAVKQAILAGDVVVGAGNIYACEALFLAGVDPRLAAGKLSRPRAAKLAAALRQVLGEALEAGGSTLRDFKDAHGVAGSFQMQARVYGREGEPCRACGTPIRRIVQGQRSTFFCPVCQKR
ncbi:LysR family transcriptional regulator [Mitsuaria sp. TWR114]|nr:LysR family transcriptional regulator [Mitsuaria sp. TWR114]